MESIDCHGGPCDIAYEADCAPWSDWSCCNAEGMKRKETVCGGNIRRHINAFCCEEEVENANNEAIATIDDETTDNVPENPVGGTQTTQPSQDISIGKLVM